MNVAFDDPAPEPEDLHAWTARGFAVAEARRWIDAGFVLDAAERWRERGVYRPEPAQAWRAAGLTPYTVGPALRAGMEPGEAVRWHELGYDRAEAAERHLAGERPHPRRLFARLFRRHRDRDLDLDDAQAETMTALLRAGVPPARARAYLDAGWRGLEALPWARTGVNATQAVLYRALGLAPEEAARSAKAGRDAEKLLRTWWDAGVPRQDVAAWLTAGFSPQEAASAVAADGTVEEAAPRAPGGREPDP
ncbi:hypothetical protein NE857_20950 [Nocardiopsis exhalans]|uniref:Uncharacterized protein n=2 Tax=Nocardiopsis TaxID=2013 RepID=A0A840W588_9ACTN|nr:MULTISPECIES: hypothetical protein [Nocardiopsis]MBB5491232.1 hypothetical protein [Nocardiopsis metallicus]USY17788.1 hypothetical protein NE857_20950 [Nocardiopsis exhalans]